MKRRVLFWGVLLAIFPLLIAGIRGSNAQDGGNTGRYKTVEVKVTQYVWDLVSNVDGHVICQVVVEHPNRPTNIEAIQICGDQIFPAEATPTPIGATLVPGTTLTPGPSPTPFDLADFFDHVSWRFVNTQEINRSVQISLPAIITNLAIPPGQTRAPFFVTLTAYEPVYGEHITGISGVLNGLEFQCSGARCDVPITRDSILDFWATSSLGDESRHVEAALRINRFENSSSLEVVSLVPITLFQDACANIWGLIGAEKPFWAQFPATPDELNTMKPYQFLAGRLIAANYVNASDCPGGGLLASGAPNTCGLERASNEVIAWQNQYDVAIWEAGREIGVPPLLIKTLFEQESQFWPGNSLFALYEYGLGQISQSGADVLLRWDNQFFSNICSGLLYDCSQVYGRMTSWQQATLRGALARTIEAECPTCSHGIDLARAYDSIPVFTRTLRANCRQVQYTLDQRELKATSYEDLWKFTFLSYHSGYNCLADALAYTAYNEQPIDWAHVSSFLSCGSGRVYVDNVWKSLNQFENYRIKTPPSTEPQVLPTFAATPVPTRTPTPIVVMSHVRVLVYVDQNGNSYPDPGELVDGAKVTATFPDNNVVTKTTVNGEAIFDLSGYKVGDEVTIALPELFRSQKIRVIQDGEIPVIFRLEEPVVPPALP